MVGSTACFCASWITTPCSLSAGIASSVAAAARHAAAVEAIRPGNCFRAATIPRIARSGRSARPLATSRGFSQTAKSSAWPSPASPALRWSVRKPWPGGTSSFIRSSCRGTSGVTASIHDGGPSGRPRCRAIIPAALNFQRAFCHRDTSAASAGTSADVAVFQRDRRTSSGKPSLPAGRSPPAAAACVGPTSAATSVARYCPLRPRSRATCSTFAAP